MKIAFLTAGGIAPCLSSSIGALIEKYNEIAPEAELIGYLNGYQGLLLNRSVVFPNSVKKDFYKLHSFGGSPIGNSRVKLTNIDDCIKRGYVNNGEDPLEIAAKNLTKDGVDILHTIGGDDTNTMAAQLSFYPRNHLDENRLWPFRLKAPTLQLRSCQKFLRLVLWVFLI